MKRRVVLALGTLMICIGLGACTQSSPVSQPVPVQSAPVYQQPPDDLYYAFIVGRGLLVDRPTAISIGYDTCTLLRTQGPAVALETIGRAAAGNISTQDAATLTLGAVQFLCSDQKAQLESYVSQTYPGL